MSELNELLDLLDRFKQRIGNAPATKRRTVSQQAVKSVKGWLKKLQPSQKDLKKELLTHPQAMEIREIWDGNKKLLPMNDLARELGLTVKKPTIDHILLGFYYPEDRLDELAARLKKAAANDPALAEREAFVDLRARLRSQTSQDSITEELERIADNDGVDKLRRFAEAIRTKDPKSNRKLSKRAKPDRLIDAISHQLWHEKLKSKAQEGR